eukprot:SAG31_NODE_34305_length_334_cov_0.885106_1_plen_93_part_01
MGKGQHAINELCCSKEVRTETQLPVFKVYSQLSQTAEQTFLHLSGQARLLGPSLALTVRIRFSRKRSIALRSLTETQTSLDCIIGSDGPRLQF